MCTRGTKFNYTNEVYKLGPGLLNWRNESCAADCCEEDVYDQPCKCEINNFDERHRPTRPTLKLMHKTYDVDYYSTVLDKICLGRDRRVVKRLIRIFIIYLLYFRVLQNFSNIMLFCRFAFFLLPDFFATARPICTKFGTNVSLWPGQKKTRAIFEKFKNQVTTAKKHRKSVNFSHTSSRFCSLWRNG